MNLTNLDALWISSHDWSPVVPDASGTVLCRSGGEFALLPITDVCSRCGAVKSGTRTPVPLRQSGVGRDSCEVMAVREVMES